MTDQLSIPSCIIDLTPIQHASGLLYGPSNPYAFPPPYPISESAEITSILAQPCQAFADHYLVIFVGGQFRVNTLVMDPEWDGPLFVLRYVGANSTQMVAECVGRDTFGKRIIRFLVVSNFRVFRPEDVISWEVGRCRVLWKYPMAGMPQRFARRAQYINCLPVPGPLFPIPFYPEDTEDNHEDDPEDTKISSSPSYLSHFLSIFSFSGFF